MSVFLVRGAVLCLAWLVLINALASALVAQFTPRIIAASRGPRFWLALRLLPAASSIGFVAFLFAPSYWRYEPRTSGEAFDVTLAVCAAAGVALLAVAAVRGISAWRAAARRTAAWTRLARPLELDEPTLPAFAVETAAPVMALVGVLRPRLLITRGVLDALTDEELSAGVAHELGHWRAWDNLKRLAMRAAPDFLRWTRAAAALEARWASAAEHAADHQACDDAHARCALASALVKVARLTPPVTPLAEPISTLVDGGEIASRVERLLSDDPPAGGQWRRWPLVAGTAAVSASQYLPLLHAVHEITELLVRSLP